MWILGESLLFQSDYDLPVYNLLQTDNEPLTLTGRQSKQLTTMDSTQSNKHLPAFNLLHTDTEQTTLTGWKSIQSQKTLHVTPCD